MKSYIYLIFSISVVVQFFAQGLELNENGGIRQSRSVVFGDFSLNWNNHAIGPYTQAQATIDFGKIGGWNPTRAYIAREKDSTTECRVTLLPNALSQKGGLIANVPIQEGTEYEVDFDMKFNWNFTWSHGGKVGFGLRIGEGNTGCDPSWDGNGGSLRIMWYSNSNRVFLQPYVYHYDMKKKCGDTFALSYPSTGNLIKGDWYHVKLYTKSNTRSNTDGRARITINGTLLLDRAIRWTTNDSMRFIRNLTFHTFRGGSTKDWMASSTDYIFYDNLVVNKIA